MLVTVEGEFSLGRGRNLAAEKATGDVLLFLDADMLVSPLLVTLVNQTVQDGTCFFPVCYSFADSTHTSGWWRKEGWGNCAITAKDFSRTPKWPEYYKWGKEDLHFRDHIKLRSKIKIVRSKVPGFCHQWHPAEMRTLFYPCKESK
jgi:glycosyltransferase involved in cell wall biosynthesis